MGLALFSEAVINNCLHKQLLMIDGLCVYIFHSHRAYLLSVCSMQHLPSESLEKYIILSLPFEFLTEFFHFYLKVEMDMIVE